MVSTSISFSISNMRLLYLTILLVVILSDSRAQIVRIGPTGGMSMNLVKMDDSRFLDSVTFEPTFGFRVGGVASFKVRNRYFLHSEIVYSLKRKSLKGKIDPDLDDKINYHYLEVPVLFSMHFKGKLGKERNFKWYLGIGPNTAFLLAGNGRVKSGELLENNIDQLKYNVVFNTRTNRDHNDEVHYTKTNRVQFGISLGGGIMIEPSPQQKVMIDLRYTFDQTIFAKSNADYLIPHDYNDNLRFRNRTISVSLMYLFEYNLKKQERNKGKSNVKM